jgi:hypothetical protein
MLRSRLVLFGLVAVASCSDSSTAPTTPNVPDVSALLAEMSPASVSQASVFAAPLVPAANFTSVDPAGCTYSSTSTFFECPTVTANGLTFTRRYQLLDRANKPQSKPDAQTFAIRTQTTVTGTINVTASGQTPLTSSYAINGNSDQTLSGIGTNAHMLNGTSTTKVQGTVQNGTLTLPIDAMQVETTALALPNAKAGEKWPKGTITLDMGPVADPFVAMTTTRIAFDGTSFVIITTTTRFGTSISCKIDLSKPGDVPACV